MSGRDLLLGVIAFVLSFAVLASISAHLNNRSQNHALENPTSPATHCASNSQ